MNPCCCICSDLFGPADEIGALPCGHAFHRACLRRWFERSKSCPQCRERTDEKRTLRVYLNVASSEGIEPDAVALQARLDESEFERRRTEARLADKERENETLTELRKALEAQAEIQQKMLREKSGAVQMFKEQIEYLKVENSKVSKLKSENAQLTSKLETLQSLQGVIEGTSAEVESMVRNIPDPEKLSTYIVVLKKSVKQAESKKKSIQDNLRALQNEYNSINSQKNELAAKCKLLEATASHFEFKYKEIEKELAEYKIDDSTIKKNDSSIQKSPIENVSNEIQSTTKLKRPRFELHSDVHSLKKYRSSPDVTTTSAESSSPYLSLKQGGILGKTIQNRPTIAKKTSLYIFQNKKISERIDGTSSVNIFKGTAKKQEELETVYDGLGGHSRPSLFPIVSPKKIPSASPKKKNLINFKRNL